MLFPTSQSSTILFPFYFFPFYGHIFLALSFFLMISLFSNIPTLISLSLFISHSSLPPHPSIQVTFTYPDLPQARYLLIVSATDRAGNRAAELSFPFTIGARRCFTCMLFYFLTIRFPFY